MSDEIRKRIADSVEKSLLTALTGSTSTNTAAATQESFTLGMLQEMVAKLPKPDTFLSSRLFPSDRAWCVEGGSERFICAHPSMWSQVEREVRRSQSDSPLVNGLLGIWPPQVIEIDPWPGDPPDVAKWRVDHWRRLTEAFEVALTPLPDWLRSAPQFGKHG
jgi:hypothetical protein